jgi:hypothetical protein
MPTFDETPAGLIALLSSVDLYKQVRWQSYEQDDRREPTDKLTEAVCASSRLRDQEPGRTDETEAHYLMVDLDVQAYLVPSTTPGHSHLYVHTENGVPWRDLVQLLKAMAACGIVESGYASASIERRSTTLRLPWIKKEPIPEDGDPMEVRVQVIIPGGERRWGKTKIRTTRQRWDAWQFIDAHADLTITSEVLPRPAYATEENVGTRPVNLCVEHETHGDYITELARNPNEGGPTGEEVLEALLDRFNIVQYLDWVKGMQSGLYSLPPATQPEAGF